MFIGVQIINNLDRPALGILNIYNILLNSQIANYTKIPMQPQVPQQKPHKNCQFVDKLLDMMEKYPDNLHWTPDGQQLIVTNLEQVENKILPDYFRHQNFASFVRQLNMYGFCKKEKCQKFLRFSHQIFRKVNKQKFYLIQRKAKTRTIKNNESKFYQSHTSLIDTIRTKSGLKTQAQDLTISLLNLKQNMHDAMRRIRSQLDKLFLQFKDTRSKNVIETMSYIQKESYGSLLKSLTKAKQIDEIIGVQFKSQNKQKPNFPLQDNEQCSLEEQLQNQNQSNENGKQHHQDSGGQISQRFEVEEDELSAFNEFQHQEERHQQ